MSDLDPPSGGAPAVPVWAYLVIAATYLVIVQGVSKLLTSGLNTARAAPAAPHRTGRGVAEQDWRAAGSFGLKSGRPR
jgi:TRAP-type mannitol/chloroaromatic compound transport system permease small subunit